MDRKAFLGALAEKATEVQLWALVRLLGALAVAMLLCVVGLCLTVGTATMIDEWHLSAKEGLTFDGLIESVATLAAAGMGFYFIQMQIREGQRQSLRLLVMEQRLGYRRDLALVIGAVHSNLSSLRRARRILLRLRGVDGQPFNSQEYLTIFGGALHLASLKGDEQEAYDARAAQLLTLLGEADAMLARRFFYDELRPDNSFVDNDTRMAELNLFFLAGRMNFPAHIPEEEARFIWGQREEEARLRSCDVVVERIDRLLAIGEALQQHMEEAFPPLGRMMDI